MTAEALDHSKPDMIGADLEREVVGVGCHASADEASSYRLFHPEEEGLPGLDGGVIF